MASPVSVEDIVKALKLIRWIQEICTNPDKNAQVRYREFKGDVDGLEQRLEEFRDAFVQATIQIDHQGSRLRGASSHYTPRTQAADAYVGDFLTTLQDCKSLLDRYVRLNARRATFLDNAFWEASTKSQVDNLRKRMKAHAEKIALLLEPVTLQLATNTAVTMEEMLEIILVHVGLVETPDLPRIPSDIADRLRQALRAHSTFQAADPCLIPVEDGVDAMKLHFQKHLEIPNEAIGAQRRFRYSEVISAGPPSRRIIRETKQGIAEQYQCEGIPQWNEFLVLGMFDFWIWPAEIVYPEPSSTEPRGSEGLLVSLSLRPSLDGEKEVFVFRANDQILRILSVFSPHNHTGRVREENKYFDLHNDRLVPLYTISTERREWNMGVVYANGAPQDDLPLMKRSDALDFQKAITRYETAAFSEGVSCISTFKELTSPRDRQLILRGEIQLLQWHLTHPTSPSPRSSPDIGSMIGTRYGSSYMAAARTFHTANSDFTTIYEANDGKTVVFTALPPSPVIVVFAQESDEYTLWKVDLDHVEIAKSHPNELRLGFTAPNTSKTFVARTFTVKSKPALKYWDLGAFLSNRNISVTDKKDKACLHGKTLKCTNFALDFADRAAKEEFLIELLEVKTRRLRQFNDAIEAREIATMEAQSSTNVSPSGIGSVRRSSAPSIRVGNASGAADTTTSLSLPALSRVSTFNIDSMSIFRR